MQKFANLIFIHGLESSSQGHKARLLRQIFPGILVPDFQGTLEERMARLETILDKGDDWIIIGSSFGGLMGTLYACAHPDGVKKLILLAPYFACSSFSERLPEPIAIPVVLIHGTQDVLIPLEEVHLFARKVFKNLEFRAVEDDHRLWKTAQQLNWQELVSIKNLANTKIQHS
ncbi:MAG: alpha/beta fold hydrolase [Chloroflexota bacterium]